MLILQKGCYYHPHPKDGGVTVFTFGRGAVLHLHPIILPLVPCSFWRVPQWLVPGPLRGGTLVVGRGYPSPRWGYLGYPHQMHTTHHVPSTLFGVQSWGWGIPTRTGLGTSRQFRTGLWYPPQPGLGYPPTPKTEHQREYLVRGGRYASCVRAGGLSCDTFNILSTRTT